MLYKECPSEIFLWNFLGSVLALGALYYWSFFLVYVVSNSSHLILFFMVRETSTLSSVTALLKFHRQPQWRWISFCPHPLHNLLFVAFLTKAILTGVRLYLMVLWTSVSQTLGDIDSFSWDLFRMLRLKLTCWNRLLEGLPKLAFLFAGLP